MATRTADLPCSFMGVPTPFSVKVTSAETWYKGSLIYQLAAGGCTKTWAASLPFIGISPHGQTIAAGGEGLIFMGPFVWKVPDTTAGLAVTDEGDDMGAIAAGDNWLDVVKYTTGTGANTASMIGRLLRFVSVTEVYVAIKDPAFYCVAKAAATATLFTP